MKFTIIDEKQKQGMKIWRDQMTHSSSVQSLKF